MRAFCEAALLTTSWPCLRCTSRSPAESLLQPVQWKEAGPYGKTVKVSIQLSSTSPQACWPPAGHVSQIAHVMYGSQMASAAVDHIQAAQLNVQHTQGCRCARTPGAYSWEGELSCMAQECRLVVPELHCQAGTHTAESLCLLERVQSFRE